MRFDELRKLLESRLEIIANAEMRERDPDGQLAQLQEVSEKIDAWTASHRAEVDRRLLHFLENYSLNKALDFINEVQTKCR